MRGRQSLFVKPRGAATQKYGRKPLTWRRTEFPFCEVSRAAKVVEHRSQRLHLGHCGGGEPYLRDSKSSDRRRSSSRRVLFDIDLLED